MVISGFNAIIDEDLLLERIRQISQYLSQLRAKTIPIYLEDGGYHIQKYKAHVLRRFGSLVDVFGFNEDELSDILQMNRKSVNMQELHSILEGLEYIAENYNIRNIVLHTKDYALYYGLDKTFDVETGLFFANLLAATRARIGEDAKQEDLQDTLLMPDSQHGITIQQQAQNLILKRHLVVSSAKYIPKPACTIGLGDTFVAGFQICF
jgi:ADP-dependent phosphofructokinase/glucokinase